MSTDHKDRVHKELKESIGQVTWADLRKHLVRDVIILVDPGIALLEAAIKVAENDQDQVSRWIADGLLTKPNSQQLEHWEKNLTVPFLSVVVQPFVLAQILN